MPHNRLSQLQKKIDVDALLIEEEKDLYYLTGLNLSAGRLLITKKDACLFVDGRYREQAVKKAPCRVEGLTQELLLKELNSHAHTTLGFDEKKSSYLAYQSLKKVAQKLKAKLVPVDSPVAFLRAIKDSEEQEKLKRAANLGSRGFRHVKSLLKVGVTELELAAELQRFWWEHGGEGAAFRPIIAFGSNTSNPHYMPTKARLKEGDPVLIDIGVTVEQYHSDMTRMVFFGEPHKKLAHAYRCVLRAQQAALALCKPGITLGEVDKAARAVLEKEGVLEFFSHSLGHGIGLDVHEFPFFRNADFVLKKGVALTIEPGVYFPGIGGIRIEDTVLITADGHENLTKIAKTIKRA
jgi:Xaa-Pro aminopeptidase